MGDTMNDNEITLKIDGKICKAQEGEYILNVARANGIFIPAICYLTRCSPTLACRICLVEADGKRVYSCNTKAKDGMEVTVTNQEILEERRAIMEVYDINHPLQCGVCDQSGSCELQNYTLELGVDSQSYTIADSKRETANWSSVLHYDPALCIVCERCVTICKDMTGDNALSTTPRGGSELNKELKDSMPKDAYAMWNKLQKSLIAPSNDTGNTDCSDCGECIAVCPTGALVSRDFEYTSNAWELKRTPATCAHCSSGCQIYYETKPTSISNRDEKIYRVTNEWNYITLCGAGRFGYDFENSTAVKNQDAFANAIRAFKEAKAIRFNSIITNEEALMLQTLKEKLKIKLINPEARAFQEFLTSYSTSSGKTLWNGNYKEMMKNTDFIISVGSSLRNDNPNVRYVFNNIQKMNKGAGLYFHPIGDSLIANLGKNVACIEHKVNREEAILYWILDQFADKDKLPADIREYLVGLHTKTTKIVSETVMEDVKETVVDETSGESKEVTKKVPKTIQKEIEVDSSTLLEAFEAPADFADTLEKFLGKKESFALVVGEDLYFHPQAANLANLVALIESTTELKVAMIPPKTNSLGVALICELDDDISGYTIGYNETGDFRLSALGDGDLDMPALNQQEGTLTNMHKRVVPTNAALSYDGYELNDIMNVLGFGKRLAIDWTKALPVKKGFKSVEFDVLPNGYTNDGVEHRGYMLEVQKTKTTASSPAKFTINDMSGEIAYRCNPQRQFNEFTAKAHQIFEPFALYVSPTKADDLGQKVALDINGKEFILDVVIDDKMSGEIVKLPDFKHSSEIYAFFGKNRFKPITLRKV
ncbi:MAG: NADH-quinone oxidoreductase subunit G [Sulfurovaceae bacterium]|nr:NADH-quinone oxidoreductase subunit G [Sulfurovaceae bacterium]